MCINRVVFVIVFHVHTVECFENSKSPLEVVKVFNKFFDIYTNIASHSYFYRTPSKTSHSTHILHYSQLHRQMYVPYAYKTHIRRFPPHTRQCGHLFANKATGDSICLCEHWNNSHCIVKWIFLYDSLKRQFLGELSNLCQ